MRGAGPLRMGLVPAPKHPSNPGAHPAPPPCHHHPAPLPPCHHHPAPALPPPPPCGTCRSPTGTPSGGGLAHAGPVPRTTTALAIAAKQEMLVTVAAAVEEPLASLVVDPAVDPALHVGGAAGGAAGCGCCWLRVLLQAVGAAGCGCCSGWWCRLRVLLCAAAGCGFCGLWV